MVLDLIRSTVDAAGALGDAFDGESPFEAGVLLHGFGANGEDLTSLSPLFPVRRLWLFPHAPAQLDWGGMVQGRAWFPREPRELEEAMTGVYFSRLREQDPSGLADSAEELLATARAEGVEWSRTILGGFSQGAMVALEVALRAPEPPKALLLFSGSLIAEERWRREAERVAEAGRAPNLFFQSHGNSDYILPYPEGRGLFGLLRAAGWEGSFVSFNGGHEIPPDVVREAHRLLYERSD